MLSVGAITGQTLSRTPRRCHARKHGEMPARPASEASLALACLTQGVGEQRWRSQAAVPATRDWEYPQATRWLPFILHPCSETCCGGVIDASRGPDLGIPRGFPGRAEVMVHGLDWTGLTADKTETNKPIP